MNVLVAVSDTRTRLQIEEVLLSRKHEFKSYPTAPEAWGDLQHNSYSLTIVDSSFQVQGESIFVCLRRLERSEFMLVLGITNTTDCGELRKMIDSGADDYLIWSEERSQLYLRLQIAELWVQQYEKWRDSTLHDSLTGVANRNLFIECVSNAIARSKRRKSYFFAVYFLDLDQFKRVNAKLGHLMGDVLLQQVAARLQSCVRPFDTVARTGGDEFAVLADDLPSKDHAILVAQRLQDQFAAAFQIQGRDLISSASIGIAIGAGEYDFPQQLLQAADRAMYRAKQQGGNCYQIAESIAQTE